MPPTPISAKSRFPLPAGEPTDCKQYQRGNANGSERGIRYIESAMHFPANRTQDLGEVRVNSGKVTAERARDSE